jgi:hypothetical protein
MPAGGTGQEFATPWNFEENFKVKNKGMHQILI